MIGWGYLDLIRDVEIRGLNVEIGGRSEWHETMSRLHIKIPEINKNDIPLHCFH
jgi:hypothetical protein